MTTYRPRWGAMAAFAVALAMASTTLAATPAMANSGNCVAAERAYKIEQKATGAAADAYALCVAQNFARDESREMPIRFIVDPDLPPDVDRITLSYSFFDLPRTAAAGR